MKICSKCNILLDYSNFYKSKGHRDGFRGICKSCQKQSYKYVKIGRRTGKIKYDENYQKNYHIQNPDYQKDYYRNNKEHLLNKSSAYYYNNKSKVNENMRKYNKKRRDNDPKYKFIGNVRNLIKNAFLRKFTTKSNKVVDILGCDFDFFSKYIESQFDSNMNWENYGDYWEIDHITPISSAVSIDDVIKLNYYTNLRPLLKIDNRKKGKSHYF